jgi:hypothetical protein
MNNKKEILQSIFEVENIKSKLIDSLLPIDYDELLNIMSKEQYSLERDLKITTNNLRKLTKTLWPDKPATNAKICGWLLSKYGYKYCPNCSTVKEHSEFSLNASRPGGLNTHCKYCYKETTRTYQREYQKRRKALKIDRVPKWANVTKIKEIYDKCPDGYHVDHIVPLQGKNVSGFHVENNLQYLSAKDNLIKHNSHITV